MRAVRQGDRGPAVEDIQRRLLALDYDLGPTGVDGVFLGRTLSAVNEFQRESEIAEDGVVGPHTWAALVDATFTLGDRLLYLRFPYLHGRDVRTIQRVMNTLGFACGDSDGIFGAFTERAVREFQQNVGHPEDGIVGAETVKALENLRHIWEGKESDAPTTLKVAPARAAEVLLRVPIAIVWRDEPAREVGERLTSLALASQPDASVVTGSEEPEAGTSLMLVLETCGDDCGEPGTPVISIHEEPAAMLTARVVTALRAERPRPDRVLVDVSDAAGADERVLQTAAVGLLDGVCAALA